MKSIGKGLIILVMLLLSACSNTPGSTQLEPTPTPTASVLRTDNILVGAYYYSWYKTTNWMGRHSQTPSSGVYESSDELTLLGHLASIKSNGIDFLALEMEQDESVKTLDEGLIEFWRNLPTTPKLKFCVFYDIDIWLDVLGFDTSNLTVTNDVALQDTLSAYVARFSEYMRMRNYLHVNGKPVLITYVSHKLPPETLQFVIEEFASHGITPYFVGDEAYYSRAEGTSLRHRVSLGYFDAVTAYNSYDGRGAATFTDFHRQELGAQTAYDFNRGYFSHCVVTYDDTKWPGRTYLPLLPEGEDDIRTTLASCFNNVFELPNNDYGILLFTTFNEWFEGSSIEPSEKYGSLIIGNIKRFIGGSL